MSGNKCQHGEKYAVKFCTFMEENIKGIQKDFMVNWSDGTRKELGYMVSVKGVGKQKHVFNFCPFCGGELLNPEIFEGDTE